MIYGSVCSGIEAATQAWHSLGWKPSFFSEIEAFPRAVLQHHYPETPLHGDFTTIEEGQYAAIDLLVGGTPCQSFSIAGLRGGLSDDRGNLALEYLRLADRLAPRWIVWENVPGVLSSGRGRDFGSFVGALVQLGYGFAYRVLDAQFFGVAQRRRRVFVVGYRGDWRRAAAVLFEPQSLRRDTAPRRAKGERVAPTVVSGPPFSRTGNERVECDAIVPVTARMRGFGDYDCDGTASALKARDYKDATDLITFGFQSTANGSEAGSPGKNISPTLRASDPMAVAFAENQQADVYEMNVTHSLSTGGGKPGQGYPALRQGYGVRRLTPVECERLQGFPDEYTRVAWKGRGSEACPDSVRYKALGNSMAVPVMHWIGARIADVERSYA